MIKVGMSYLFFYVKIKFIINSYRIVILIMSDEDNIINKYK